MEVQTVERRSGRPARRCEVSRRGRCDLRDRDPELLVGDDAGAPIPVDLIQLSVGLLERLPRPERGDEFDAYVVLKGSIASRSAIGGRTAADLHGPGDVISPARGAASNGAGAGWSRSWSVLQPAELAAFDLARVPPEQLFPLTRGMFERMAPSADELRLRLAISQSPKLATRVEAALWRFAERWGRQGVEGVRLAVGLTQGILAECVCAHRTSVVVALGELEDAGRLRREGRGVYLLLGEPPTDLT